MASVARWHWLSVLVVQWLGVRTRCAKQVPFGRRFRRSVCRPYVGPSVMFLPTCLGSKEAKLATRSLLLFRPYMIQLLGYSQDFTLCIMRIVNRDWFSDTSSGKLFLRCWSDIAFQRALDELIAKLSRVALTSTVKHISHQGIVGRSRRGPRSPNLWNRKSRQFTVADRWASQIGYSYLLQGVTAILLNAQEATC